MPKPQVTGRRALLLSRGRADAVLRWAERGLGPVWVAPSLSWTLVAPAGPAQAAAPYDDPGLALAGRPLPGRLRPALALVVDGDRALVLGRGEGRRDAQRWLVWTKGTGLTDPGDLPKASLRWLADLAHAGPDGVDRLRELLGRGDGDPADLLDDVVRALSLPGAGVLVGAVGAGDLPDAVRVEVDAERVARFDHLVGEEARLAADLEGGSR